MGERITVHAGLRRRLAQLGPLGEQWLAELPAMVAELERRWGITVTEALDGGNAGYVAAARNRDGEDVVIKLGVPGEDLSRQARTIAAARGRGYVRMLAHDRDRDAMLLEALGPTLAADALGPEATMATLCRMLRQAWAVPRPDLMGIVPADLKARQLTDLVARLWDELGRPCSTAVAERALEYARRRAEAFGPATSVVVHGDPHPGNALRVRRPRPGAESGYVFVDPDGFLEDPAYDLGVVLRDWCPQLRAGDAASLAHRFCRLLASETGVDATAIWEWGFLERVSTGLHVLGLGAEQMAQPFLATAELLVEHGEPP